MNSHRSLATVLVSLLFGAAWGGCTVIVNPKDDVELCDNVEECPDPEDTRYEAQCIHGEGSYAGVCVASLVADVRCDPSAYDDYKDDPLVVESTAYGDAKYYQSDCTGERLGSRGCPGPCQAGLELNINGVCDEPQDENNPFPPAVQATGTLAVRDYQDQFCRSYFCGLNYYCDTTRSTPVCRPCDPTVPFAEGGCGDLYIDGQRSCAYRSAQEVADADCKVPESDHSTTTMGECAGIREPSDSDDSGDSGNTDESGGTDDSGGTDESGGSDDSGT